MASLTTSYQKLGEVDLGVVYGSAHAYYRIYGKYNSQDVVTVTTSVTFQARIFIAGSGTSYSASGHYNRITFNGINGENSPGYQTYYAGETTVLTSSFTLQHNTSTGVGSGTVNGGHSDGYYGSKSIGNITVTVPTIAVKPTLSISSVGIFGTSGCSVKYVLGNTGGRSTTVQWSHNNSNWYTLDTKSANGTYTNSIAVSNLSKWTTTNKPTIYFRATNNGGTTSVVSKSTTIDASIKPTISNFTVTPVNTISALNGLWVQNITKINAVTTASGIYSSTISKYTIGISYNGSETSYEGSADWTSNTITGTGTLKISSLVTDSRTVNSDKVYSSEYSIIEYQNPILVSTVKRCDSLGNLNSLGKYAKLNASYIVHTILNGTTELNSVLLQYSLNNGTTWITIPTTEFEDTKEVIINGNFDVETEYTILVKVTDINTSVQVTDILLKTIDEVESYFYPTINQDSSIYRPFPTSNEMAVDFRGLFYNGYFDLAEQNLNELYIDCYVRESEEDEWTYCKSVYSQQHSGTTSFILNEDYTIEGNEYSSEYSAMLYNPLDTLGYWDYQKTYYFKLEISDKVYRSSGKVVPYNQIIGPGEPYFDWWREGDKNYFNVNGEYLQYGEPFESGGGDTLPINSIVEYEGDTVPEGYQEYIDRVVLYNNPLGTTGDVTLSDNITNYSYIEIYWHGNNNNEGSKKLKVTGNEIIFSLNNTWQIGSTSEQRIQTDVREYKITGNSILHTHGASSYINFGGNKNITSTGTQDSFKILEVVGYK